MAELGLAFQEGDAEVGCAGDVGGAGPGGVGNGGTVGGERDSSVASGRSRAVPVACQ